MKLLLITLLMLISSISCINESSDDSENNKWKLIWEDNFDGDELDTTNWNLINTLPARYNNASDWNRHMISDQKVYAVKDGKLYLTGINNPGTLDDPRPFLTGGVNSRGKFSFLYGKIEIRAKKECAQGAWPAIWMIPQEVFMEAGHIAGKLILWNI